MAKVILSEKMRAILNDDKAREQLSKAMENQTKSKVGAGQTVNYDGKTYRVVVNVGAGTKSR